MTKRKGQLDSTVTERKRQATMDAFFVKREPVSPKRASFFGLPGEVRNEIYAYIFDDVYEQMVDEYDEALRVTSYCFKQPPLCRVNKQLRMETLGLFYGSPRLPGHFEIVIRDLKPGPQRDHFAWGQSHSVFLEGTYSWANFKEWLRLYWSKPKMTTLSQQHGYYTDSSEEDVFGSAFRMVNKLADAGVKWDVVSSILEDYRVATDTACVDEGRYPFWQ